MKKAVAFFVAPFGILFTLFYLVPIGYAVVQSLYVVKRTGTFGPAREEFGGLAQYERVFSDGPFWESVGRVLAFGVVQVPVMLGIALALALLLDSGLVTGKRFFRLAFFVPYAVPGVLAAIMWGFLYSPNLSPLKPVTSAVDFLSADLVLWAMANVVTWVYVGYNMLIIYSALLAIPSQIFEAARMDGASLWGEIIYVLTPMAIPGIASTMLLNIILAWNEAFWTIVLTTTDAAPLTKFISGFSSPQGLFYAKLSAASTMAIAPILIMGWFSQKQLVRGLTFGAVK